MGIVFGRESTLHRNVTQNENALIIGGAAEFLRSATQNYRCIRDATTRSIGHSNREL
jgi:hypothetical protein